MLKHFATLNSINPTRRIYTLKEIIVTITLLYVFLYVRSVLHIILYILYYIYYIYYIIILYYILFIYIIIIHIILFFYKKN